MLRRIRGRLLLLALTLLAASGLWFLWRGTQGARAPGEIDDPDLRSAREALLPPEKDSTPAPPSLAPGQVIDTGKPAGRTLPDSRTRERDPRAQDEPESTAETASLQGALLDRSGHPLADARVYLAPWIEAEPPTLSPSAANPFSARAELPLAPKLAPECALRLPIDVAQTQSLGLPTARCVRTDVAGVFHAGALAPGRWRMLVRSTQAPYERNDLRLAAGEGRDLGPLVLSPGVVYRLEVRAALEAHREDLVASVFDPAFGSAFPPLASGAGGPFLAPFFEHDPLRRTLPQRPIPLRVRFALPGTLAREIELDPRSSATLALEFFESWRLEGQFEAPPVDAAGPQYWVRGTPLDFSVPRVPAEARADVLRSPAVPRKTLLLPVADFDATYELRAGWGDEPLDLDSPWSPPVFAGFDMRKRDSADDSFARSARVRERHLKLDARLEWRADAALRCEIELAGWTQPRTHPEAFLAGFWSRDRALELPFELERGANELARGPFELSRGTNELAHLRPRAARGSLWLRAPGTEVFELPLRLQPSTTAHLGRLTLVALSSVPVRVVDARSAAPIAEATIQSFEGGADLGAGQPFGALVASSDAHGEATAFTPADAGSIFEIRAPDYAPLVVPARALGKGGTLVARLVRGATLHVRVLDENGAPVRALGVECTRGEWAPDVGSFAPLAHAALTDFDGRATFEHVGPGRHALRVVRSRLLRPSEWSPVELADREERELTLSTEGWANVHLRVAGPDGALANVRVTLAPDPFASADLALPLHADLALPYGTDAWTDERGEVLFEALEPGIYRCITTFPNANLRPACTLRLRSGPQSPSFDCSASLEFSCTTPDTGAADLIEVRLLAPSFPLPASSRSSRPSSSSLDLADFQLEDSARLDQRRGRADVTLASPGPVRLPGLSPALAPRIFATRGDALAADTAAFAPSATSIAGSASVASSAHSLASSATSALDLQPTCTLDFAALDLRPGERYVLAIGRDLQQLVETFLRAHPEFDRSHTEDLRTAFASQLTLPANGSPDTTFFVDRTLPFVAPGRRYESSIRWLFPGPWHFQLFHVDPATSRVRALATSDLDLALHKSARLRLTAKD